MAEEKKPADITTKSGSKESANEARKAAGLYNVTYLKDHGNKTEGENAQMHLSTAKALAAHKVVKVGSKVTVVTKPKR